jgi:hypothetical protein
VAFLPLSGSARLADTRCRRPVRTGGDIRDTPKGYAAMEPLLLLVLLLVLGLASVLGLTADSRDSADWKPTTDGRRWRARPS